MRRLLVLGCVLALIACDGSVPNSGGNPPGPSGNGAGLGFDPAELDEASPPGTDFWRYVNGRWLDTTEIPADWSSYGVYQQLVERTEEQLRQIVESPRAGEQARLSGLYRSFMDYQRRNQLGLTPLEPELNAIASLRTHENVIGWLGEAVARGIPGPVTLYIDADGQDPSRNLAYFWQDGLGLPDRDYYLESGAELAAVRKAYRAHIRAMYRLAGWADPEAAASAIYSIEKRIAELHWSAVRNRDEQVIYSNQYDLEGALALSPGFDWRDFLGRGGFGIPDRFVIAQTDYFGALGRLIREVPVSDWQRYLSFRVLKNAAPYLDSAIEAENFAFQGGVLRGQPQDREAWRRGVRLVSEELGELLGRAYVEKHFPAASRSRVTEIVENLRAAFEESVEELDWMSAATRKAARLKLARFRAKVGYPDRWIDYSNVVIHADDLIGNLRRTRAFAHRRDLEHLAKPVDRDEWEMTPQTINAYFRATYNEVVFPAAYLQPPYFDPAADDAWNYGNLGATIGHEFSHGFDDQGRKFDGDGRLRDWWTSDDARRYEARAKKLVEQFNSYRPLPDQAINGELTLGENIADLAGAIIAYRAYRRSLNGAEAPVIAGFTGDQRFFIAYAYGYREKDRPERLREQLLSDPHSPSEYRVTGILRNMPEFHTAFGVTAGDPMYLPPGELVRIW